MTHHVTADLFPPLPEIAHFPERQEEQSSPLIGLLKYSAVIGESTDVSTNVFKHLDFRGRQALTLTCFDFREMNLLRGVRDLSVDPSDASWQTAVYIARLPQLQVLRVLGEMALPEMDLAQLRRLDRLKVGTIGVPAALFFGAIIATSNVAGGPLLRLSNDKQKRLNGKWDLKKLRKDDGNTTSDADLAALLGPLAVANQLAIPPDRHVSVLVRVAYATAAGRCIECAQQGVQECAGGCCCPPYCTCDDCCYCRGTFFCPSCVRRVRVM